MFEVCQVYAFNVWNIKSHKTFEDDTVRLAVEEGFEHTDTYKLQLSSQRVRNTGFPCVYIQKTLKSLDTIYQDSRNRPPAPSRPAENLRFKGNYNDILKNPYISTLKKLKKCSYFA